MTFQAAAAAAAGNRIWEIQKTRLSLQYYNSSENIIANVIACRSSNWSLVRRVGGCFEQNAGGSFCNGVSSGNKAAAPTPWRQVLLLLLLLLTMWWVPVVVSTVKLQWCFVNCKLWRKFGSSFFFNSRTHKFTALIFIFIFGSVLWCAAGR